MIPRYGIEIWVDDPAGFGGYPSRRAALSGYLDGNRDYEPGLLRATWEEAAGALEIERSRLDEASLAENAARFDELIDGDLEDWEMMALHVLDAGVAGAVLALNAAGCLTASSCRGHAWMSGEAVRPWIRVYADPRRGALIAEAAAATGCGLALGDGPAALLFAPSVVEILDFATDMLAMRPRFEQFPARRFGPVSTPQPAARR